MIRNLAALSFFALCVSTRAMTAQSLAPSPQQPPTILRSSTHLVQVNVVALDKKAEPVLDLTASDFVLTDDGEKEKVSIFSLEKSDTAPQPAAPLVPGTFSNRWEDQPEAPSSVTVVLLDAVNTSYNDQAYARQNVADFLKGVHPQDRVAVYALGRDLEMLHDFSGDGGALATAVMAYKGEYSSALDAPPDTTSGRTVARNPLAQAAHDTADQGQADFLVDRRAFLTLGAIESIARYLARLPGRKNLIWVSDGFPFSLGYESLRESGPKRANAAIVDEMETLARALNNANLAIYPVGARGLVTRQTVVTRPVTGNPFVQGSQASQPFMTRTRSGSGDADSEIDTMQEIAQRTGGRAYYDTNDVAGALQQAVQDARATYVLGYYPEHVNWDGKFHRIKLSVKRPGVQLRYRLGYFAVPDEAPTTGERKVRVDAAVWSPFDDAGIRLVAHAHYAGASAPHALDVEVVADSRDVTLLPRNDRWTGELDVLMVQLSSDRHNLNGTSKSYVLNLSTDTRDRLVKDGFLMRNRLDLLPGATEVRVVVHDTISDAIGSVTIPLAKVQVAAQ
jgi:VWFA-related protein